MKVYPFLRSVARKGTKPVPAVITAHKFQNGSCSICGKQQGSISPDRPTRPSWGFIWEIIFSWWN